MPSYKTHSIHGEVVLPQADKRIDINPEDMKTFCIGADTLIMTDYKLFDFQHCNNIRDYFQFILRYIKQNKLQDNSEVMAFLYGQLDHFILDATTHPFIYYGTKNAHSAYRCDIHGLVEMWIDDLIMKFYNIKKNGYYAKFQIESKELLGLIDHTYLKIYNRKHESSKYQFGIMFILAFEELIRNNRILIADKLVDFFNVGDIMYKDHSSRLKPYLNFNHRIWRNPETNERRTESFMDLWDKSMVESIETIEDVNRYLYDGKPLNNFYIDCDISYNTGLPCSEGQKYTYARR